jgi:hypothetical protein
MHFRGHIIKPTHLHVKHVPTHQPGTWANKTPVYTAATLCVDNSPKNLEGSSPFNQCALHRNAFNPDTGQHAEYVNCAILAMTPSYGEHRVLTNLAGCAKAMAKQCPPALKLETVFLFIPANF